MSGPHFHTFTAEEGVIDFNYAPRQDDPVGTESETFDTEAASKPLTPTEVRLRLRKSGYSPIPTRGKNPGLAPRWSWQKFFNASDEQIELWSASFPDARNTGILCRDNPMLDIDILRAEAATAAEEIARDWIEERDGIKLVRFGLPPKRSIPFKTSEPFKKIAVALQAPDGTEQKIEFLCDGQQSIVDGIHPDTRKPYGWHGCDRLSDVKSADLPAINGAEAKALVDSIVKKLVDDLGYRLRASSKKTSSRRKHVDGQEQQGGDWQPKTFWDRVNVAAMKNLGSWVPILFKGAKFYEGTGAYRISSGMLKRDLEEDLSIAPSGIKDWGLYDQGDENEGRRTAIDIVVEWSVFAGIAPGVPFTTKAAALWLCNCLEIDPATLGWQPEAPPQHEDVAGYKIEDFYSYLPGHTYLFVPTRQLWPGGSVNAVVPHESGEAFDEETGKLKTTSILPTMILDKTRAIAQMTWAPGLPELIKGKIVAEGGWFDQPGKDTFNQYLPPIADPAGDPARAGPWVEHANKVYGRYATHIILWLAHRAQKPQDKVNHSLVLGGEPGIGKDTLLEPVKHAVGPWNWAEVSPVQLLGRFNSFAKSIVLRVSESRDLGEVDRYALHDHLKTYQAAPPDVLRVDEKHIREYYIANVTGVILTTNHRTDCLYLPAEDRRHFVAWSELTKADFCEGYWNKLWRFYADGGIAHVCAYLRALDISAFDPKAPPEKTDAFWAIVDAGRPSEESELTDVLESFILGLAEDPHDPARKVPVYGAPTAVTVAQLVIAARRLATASANVPVSGRDAARDQHIDGMREMTIAQTVSSTGLADWLMDRKNRRLIPHRLEKVGYTPIRNPAAADGLWKIVGKRQAVYAMKDKTEGERLDAAGKLADGETVF